MLKIYIKSYQKKIGETPELFHNDYFKLKGGELYYIGSRKPLATERKLIGMLADILGKNRLRRLGFNITLSKLTARQTVMSFSYSCWSYEQCSVWFFHKHFSNLIHSRNVCTILDV